MRLLLFILLLPLTSISQLAEVHKVIVRTPVKEIKLFLTAGEMHHADKIKLVKGRNRIVFSGISALADPQSIRFKSDGDYRLLSLTTEMDFLIAEQMNPRIKNLNDTLELLSDKYHLNMNELAAYDAELSVLNTNKKIGGNNENLSVEEIKAAAAYYRKRTLEIKQAQTEINKEQQVLNARIENIRFQLVELNYNENQRSNQVMILLDSDKDQTINADLKYLVSDCGWAAMYDLEALDITGPIELRYKAQVYNNTGTIWNNIKLTLSTADPNLSAQYPELTPWYIRYYSQGKYKSQPKVQLQKIDYRQQAISNINSANDRVYDNYIVNNGNLETNQLNGKFSNNVFEWKRIQEQRLNNKTSVEIKQIQISELSTEFEIAHTFSCPSDSKPYMVGIKELKLDASFSHVSVPKLDNAAFLMANITGWEELELMPGPTNVYFGGAYVGVSEIDTRNVSDTLSLSFGRDNKVLVMRKLRREMTVKKVIGNMKKDSYEYEIVIKNNREVPIKVDVYDQIPLSQNDQITVYTDELSEGMKDEESGEVVWELKINPSETKNMRIGYSVKYPKGVRVEQRSFRTISAPSF